MTPTRFNTGALLVMLALVAQSTAFANPIGTAVKSAAKGLSEVVSKVAKQETDELVRTHIDWLENGASPPDSPLIDTDLVQYVRERLTDKPVLLGKVERIMKDIGADPITPPSDEARKELFRLLTEYRDRQVTHPALCTGTCVTPRLTDYRLEEVDKGKWELSVPKDHFEIAYQRPGAVARQLEETGVSCKPTPTLCVSPRKSSFELACRAFSIEITTDGIVSVSDMLGGRVTVQLP